MSEVLSPLLDVMMGCCVHAKALPAEVNTYWDRCLCLLKSCARPCLMGCHEVCEKGSAAGCSYHGFSVPPGTMGPRKGWQPVIIVCTSWCAPSLQRIQEESLTGGLAVVSVVPWMMFSKRTMAQGKPLGRVAGSCGEDQPQGNHRPCGEASFATSEIPAWFRQPSGGSTFWWSNPGV